jgi:hypothetical protein
MKWYAGSPQPVHELFMPKQGREFVAWWNQQEKKMGERGKEPK